MIYLNIKDVIEFKNTVEKEFNINIHFHDSCGGQYFSLDETLNDELKRFISYYFERKNLITIFSQDKNSFVVKHKTETTLKN